ncbi:VOC family protein [Conexibacter sp. SYSU D00693]|uniref:VOC family protein n=1 Tax=Conexibacter sp. SYSU D00693 TaxID=2812560 RepID=UPI00196B06EF|nr:VOC family protein [Conexibacter sp. SYSU D00693]
MALEGLHHVTAITADAPRNVDFHVRVLGLRLVKKTVNFDAPDVYHLYYGDELGRPGSIMTYFEFPDAAPGRPGDGMVHTVQWRVASDASVDFWEARLRDHGVAASRADGALRFADPDGLAYELVAAGDLPDAPLAADAPDVPEEHRILGFHGVRAYAGRPEASAPLLEALGFTGAGSAWEVRGVARGAVLAYEPPPAARGLQGAGTVHHVAWSAADDDELVAVRQAAVAAGAHPTGLVDRQYFHSVYFREPSGVLFELASRDIGFDADEPAETLGQALKLPPQHEHLRPLLEQRLTPLPDPRAEQRA